MCRALDLIPNTHIQYFLFWGDGEDVLRLIYPSGAAYRPGELYIDEDEALKSKEKKAELLANPNLRSN